MPADNHRRSERSALRALCLFGLLATSPAEGRVVHLTVEHREAAGGDGQYERLTGHFDGELDPKNALVAPVRSAMNFPAIPGAPLPDNLINTLPNYDFGLDFRYNDLSGAISIQPPVMRGIIPMLVPKTDADGNEIGGIPSVLHQAPLGTYLGWNVTAAGYFRGRACGFSGGFIPFAKTRQQRLASGDPRPSLEEGYGTHEKYVEKVREAAHRLVPERFLWPEDADRLVREADASAVLR